MRVIITFLILLLIFGFVSAQTTANVEAERIHRPNFFSQMVSFVTKYAIWIAIFFILIIMIVFIVILIKSLNKRIDPFKAEYVKVKKLSKFHSDPTMKDIFSVADGHLECLGHYLGECYTQDGFFNILGWKHKKWYLFWVPLKLDFLDLAKDSFVVRCNMNDTFKEKIIDPQTK